MPEFTRIHRSQLALPFRTRRRATKKSVGDDQWPTMRQGTFQKFQAVGIKRSARLRRYTRRSFTLSEAFRGGAVHCCSDGKLACDGPCNTRRQLVDN
jgi:hypothetical protein